MSGYENRVLAARDFNDDTKDAGELGAGHSVTILYEIIPTGSSSNFQVSIDPLKYQTNIPRRKDPQLKATEIGTIKSRFKLPDSDISTRNEQLINNEQVKWDQVSSDIKWAASVAEWGMQLRDSKYLNDREYAQLIDQMKRLTKNESDPYKKSCLNLVEIAAALEN